MEVVYQLELLTPAQQASHCPVSELRRGRSDMGLCRSFQSIVPDDNNCIQPWHCHASAILSQPVQCTPGQATVVSLASCLENHGQHTTVTRRGSLGKRSGHSFRQYIPSRRLGVRSELMEVRGRWSRCREEKDATRWTRSRWR